jgi:CDP-glycerol glycerophosphotransferase (TagB/SpsB family)
VSGQIRTDIIPVLMSKPFTKQHVLPVITSHEKLIVFASQPQRDPRLRKRAAMDVMQAVKEIPGAFLLVKLHPNERHDTGYYKNIAQQARLERIKITLDLDLYMLISVCDILITCFSTVGTETIYFKKPLVILDHLGQDIQGYHREGVALQARNSKELKTHLSSLLNGEAGIDETAYERFIEKYAYSIDGKASDRVLDFIERLSD